MIRRTAAVAALLGMLGFADGWIGPRPARSQPAPPHAQAADEKPIRDVDDAFVRGYNRGDTRALAALFTDDAEAIEPGGERLQGRDAIEHRFAQTFAASPGVKIAIEIGSIRFLSPDVAREEGRTVVTPAREARQVRPYTALFVRRDGRWRIASIREEADPLVSPHDRLRDLEWLVGDWIDEGPDSHVRIHCRWSEDGHFLVRSFAVKHQGRPVMTVTQRIGWDPMARRIRSWEFDSEGGFGEGTWSRDGDRWTIKHTGVRPEGVAASSTQVMTRERTDLVRWSSTDRVHGEESIPGTHHYAFVRVPPAPRLPGAVGAVPPASPDPTRSR